MFIVFYNSINRVFIGCFGNIFARFSDKIGQQFLKPSNTELVSFLTVLFILKTLIMQE